MRNYEELIGMDRQQISWNDKAEALVVASELHKISATSKEADKKLIVMCSVFDLNYGDLWGIQGQYVR